MKLLTDPPTQPPTSSKKSQSSKESQTSSSHFDDAYYNSLNAQVLNLVTDQEKLFNQQAILLKNQNEIMNNLQYLTIKVNVVYDFLMDRRQFTTTTPPDPMHEIKLDAMHVHVHVLFISFQNSIMFKHFCFSSLFCNFFSTWFVIVSIFSF